jgi:arylsulfatase A-like enzyme
MIVLIADDHRYESVGAHGNVDACTPNLDALAARGLACDGAHCQGGMHGAICVPSRASLMTGRDIFAAAMDPTGRDYRVSQPIPAGLPTFPERLRAAGYHTHAVGKWHNDAASFHRSCARAERIVFGGMSDLIGCRCTATIPRRLSSRSGDLRPGVFDGSLRRCRDPLSRRASGR